RDDKGELNRGDSIRLGQLPGEQGKLSDRVSAMDKDLAAVGAVVYLWSNKDIVAAMTGVKSDLGKPETGEGTQTEQARILAQLDSMIRNLATKPRDSKFAQDGGGGDGQSKPVLPAEAELRLLKDLQSTVNGNTKAADAAPKRDRDRLSSLGTRQGELRDLLDKLLQNASQGQLKLGPEPDNRDQLPEEANAEDVENSELDKNLLDDKPDAEKEQKQYALVGDRMARSRQRLALNNDPGKVTQVIQERILNDLDDLIEQARQAQAQTRNPKPGAKPGEQMPKPGEQTANAQNQGAKPGEKPNIGVSPAGDTYRPGQASNAANLSKDIVERLAEWGGLTPRVREAVIEGANENIVQEYRQLVEDYYRSLATKTTER
ncbi:MAG: hypothetical protein ACREJC_09675, partial [Tepidisphaeraceae bacterium]